MQSEMNTPAALIKVEVETSSPSKRKISRKAQLTHVHRRRDEEPSHQPRHGFSKVLAVSINSQIVLALVRSLYTCLYTKNPHHFLKRHKCRHAQFRIRLQITRLFFPYMETNWRLTWIVMAPGKLCKFHAPSPPLAAHKLLIPIIWNLSLHWSFLEIIIVKLLFLLGYIISR